MTLATAVLIAFTFGLSSIACFAAANTVLRLDRASLLKLMLIGMPFGPFAVEWIFEAMLRVAPGHDDAFYQWGVGAVFIALGVAGANQLRLVAGSFFTGLASLADVRPLRDGAALVLFGFTCWILYNAFGMSLTQPLAGVDQMQYARLAQAFYEMKSTSFYPVLTEGSALGYAIGGAHPIAYPLLIAWSHMISGSSEALSFARFINPMFLVLTVFSLYGCFKDQPRTFGAMAGFLYACTPTIFTLTYSFHIDPTRIAGFQLAIGLMFFAIQQPSRATFALAGVGLGFGLNTHSAGILCLPIVAGCLLLLQAKPLKGRIESVAITITVGCLVGGHRYLTNFLQVGAVVTDNLGIWRLHAEQQEAFVQATRQLTTLRERLKYGLLRSLFEPQFFGNVFWIAPIATIPLFFRRQWRNWAGISFTVVAIFFGLGAISMFAEGSTFIKNMRYFLTIQPMIASLAAFVVGTVHDRFVRP